MRVTLKRSFQAIALSLFTISNLSSVTTIAAILAGIGILTTLQSASAQTITGGGYTATAYSPTDIPFQSITGTSILSSSQNGAASVLLGTSANPFLFNFFGTSYSSINIGVDGILSFANTSANSSGANVDLNTTPVSRPTIAVLWDNWRTQGNANSSNVNYALLGDTVGSRRFVVQWNNLRNQNAGASASNRATFQAVLYEGSNKILFAYDDISVGGSVADNGESATIGISNYTSNANSSQRLQWSYNTTFSGYSLCFNPTPNPSNPPAPATCPQDD